LKGDVSLSSLSTNLLLGAYIKLNM